MSRRRGRFIVLEGLDGAGTTTQTERIAAVLRERGHRVLTTREPSDGPLGTQLRQALTRRLVRPDGAPLTPETLALMFAADRTDHLASSILPALQAGQVVLSDRYLLSSLAYQGATLPMAWIDEINARARSPDLTLFVEVSTRTAARRRAGRGSPEELFEAEALQRKIAKKYDEAIVRRAVQDHIVRVSGEGTVDAVTAACLAPLAKLLKTVGG